MVPHELTRLVMAVALNGLPRQAALPEPCFWVPWSDDLIDHFADVHFRAFSDTLDVFLFPSFGSRVGCFHLIREIRGRASFLPKASWLIASPEGCLATIMCNHGGGREGTISNVAVVPEARGRGLGAALVERALIAFRQAGLQRGVLEVTAENTPAVRLYAKLGFRKMSTFTLSVHLFEGVRRG